MFTILFIIYLAAGCLLITRLRFVKDSGLNTKTIILLFLIKVSAGCILGLVNHLLFNNLTDYDGYNDAGIAEYRILFSDPHRFFTDIFKTNYNEYGEFFGSKGSYWNDLRTNIIFKILAVFNIFTGGNYFINSLFFNFCSFLGHIALYRVYKQVYPEHSIPLILACFLLPSLLYFSSGIHKDLFVFTALSFFCYSLYFSLERYFNAKKVFLLIFSFFTVLLIRNFIAVLLLPCAIAWVISYRYKIKPAIVFSGLLFAIITGSIMLHFYFPKGDPLSITVNKQQAFLSLGKGTTQFNNDTLQPTIKSFIKAAPKALRHSFLSPYPREFSNPYVNLFAAEQVFYSLLFLVMLIFPIKQNIRPKEFIYFGLVFTFLVFLFTGYITTTAGALIRYRSIYLPFLMAPIFYHIYLRFCKRT